jgi:hypothetical protein
MELKGLSFAPKCQINISLIFDLQAEKNVLRTLIRRDRSRKKSHGKKMAARNSEINIAFVNNLIKNTGTTFFPLSFTPPH